MYIIEGLPGAGKTILTSQICFHQVAIGTKALFVTLLAENHSRMMSNLAELSFFDPSRIPDYLAYLSAFNEVKEGGLKALLDLLRREVMRRRTGLLVIDGLVSAQTSAATDQQFKEFIHDLQEIAIATNCTMFLTTTARERVSPEQTMVDGLIQLTSRSYGWQTASDLQVTKLRGSGFLRGRHSYKITEAGLTLYPRIESLYSRPTQNERPEFGSVTSGIDQLDVMLGKGLPRASTTMLAGPSGIGKTTIGLQFLAASAPDEPGLMFSFYETPTRVRAKIDSMVLSLGDKLDSGQVNIQWQTSTSDLLDVHGDRLLEIVKRRGVKRLFIDGLTAFHSAAIDPSRTGNFFSALTNELRNLGVTTLYSLEMSDVFGARMHLPIEDSSSLAENIILLNYVAQRSRLHRLISIIKVRDSNFDPTQRTFVIGDFGVEISESNNEAEALLADLAGQSRGYVPPRGG
ncbi:hypothetical protein AEYBE204_10475 [Asticcacaulis sp. YBE204]|nr:hypothetical protein AEYBE204_10475 [Asticcacaulis sp. YBE204]